MCLMDLATYASKEKKLQKKANEFYKLAHDARKNVFMCPGPAEEPSTIEDDANTPDAKDESKGGYMSTSTSKEGGHNGKGKYLNLKKAHVGGCHGYLEGHALTDIIINYGGCAPKGSWVSRACTIGKSLRVL